MFRGETRQRELNSKCQFQKPNDKKNSQANKPTNVQMPTDKFACSRYREFTMFFRASEFKHRMNYKEFVFAFAERKETIFHGFRKLDSVSIDSLSAISEILCLFVSACVFGHKFHPSSRHSLANCIKIEIYFESVNSVRVHFSFDNQKNAVSNISSRCLYYFTLVTFCCASNIFSHCKSESHARSNKPAAVFCVLLYVYVSVSPISPPIS